MGGGGGGTQKSVTEIKLPAWVDKASQSNYKFAQKIADKPYQAYGGDLVADIPGVTQDAWKTYLDSMGMGQSQFGQAGDIYGGLGGFQSDKVSAGQFTDVDLQKYMNPYIQNVENAAFSNYDRAAQQELMGNADKAVAAGAFGGDRSAIVDALTRSENVRNKGQLSAELRAKGFDTAAGLATGDIERRFGADKFNVQSALDAAGIRERGAAGLIGAGQAMRGARAEDTTGALAIGQQQQDQAQREIEASKGAFEEARDYDLQRLNILLSSLGMSPYGRTETTKTSASGGGTDWASAALGGMKLLGGLFSDRRHKKDIEKLGKDPASGLDIYAYRYKKDKGGPKVVGPMAQDVEKMYPGSTTEIDGKMVILPGVLGVLSNG